MKIRTFLMLLLVSFSFLSVNAFAKNSLVGNWTSSKIKLHIKANNHYSYTVKILGIKKKFVGNWSTKVVTKKNGKKKNILVLSYTLFGQHKKIAQYSFSKGKLKLTQDGKVSYLTRK